MNKQCQAARAEYLRINISYSYFRTTIGLIYMYSRCTLFLWRKTRPACNLIHILKFFVESREKGVGRALEEIARKSSYKSQPPSA